MRALLLVLVFASQALAWTEGFNFRDNLAYCTDPTDTQFVQCNNGGSYDAYPKTAGSVTFGYTDGTNNDCDRDRDSGLDCRLAGRASRTDAQTNSLGQVVFRVDLPSAGNYTVKMALGDASFSTTDPYVQIYDDTTLLDTINYTGTVPAGDFLDADEVVRTSAADWVSNNVGRTYAFATTTFFIKYANAAGSGGTGIAHLNIEDAPASGSNVMSVKKKK